MGSPLVILVHFQWSKPSDAGGSVCEIAQGWKLQIDSEADPVQYENLIFESTSSQILVHGVFEQMDGNLFT